MRIIDADAFEIELQHEWENNEISNGEWMDIRQWLKDAPTIDAEPVVRCKDCKFNYANQIPSGDECQLCVELPISKDFYCAFGEKKTDEVNDETKTD